METPVYEDSDLDNQESYSIAISLCICVGVGLALFTGVIYGIACFVGSYL
jgi:hypothetical protein